MAEPSSVENLRRGYKAFADNDVATLSEIIPEDAVWHVPGRSQLAGDYRGRDAIFGYFMKLSELTGGTFKAELVRYEPPGSALIPASEARGGPVRIPISRTRPRGDGSNAA